MDDVIVAGIGGMGSACSGWSASTSRTFKFCSVVGDIMAELALESGSTHDIGMFGLKRFADNKRRPLGPALTC